MSKYLIVLICLLSINVFAQYDILPLKKQAEFIDELTKERIETIIPELMKREGIDMWLVISREYNEDHVIKTMLPANWLSARRRTILMFYLSPEGNFEKLAVSRYDVGDIFKAAWDPESHPHQYNWLAQMIKQRNPSKIGLNFSDHFGLADGVSFTEVEELNKALSKNDRNKIVSAEKLAIGWLETRIPREIPIYRQICGIAHSIIAEGFSNKVITPGITTTEDVVWFFRERVRELGMEVWFHPTVSIQRQDPENFDHLRSFSSRPGTNVILPGDLLHVDFGITYLRLNTDTQQHAYVLKHDDNMVPKYLEDAFKRGNRLQDIFTNNFKLGRTGNEILKMSREQSLKEGIKPSIYSHPIGYHGHGAGTTLGMWDQQDGVPYTGDYPMHKNTAYSIELNAATYIEEWGKEIRIMLEEEAFFDGENVFYIDGRQTKLLIIK